jgi:DNA-binding protein YbaB
MSAEFDASVGTPGDDYAERTRRLDQMRRDLEEVEATARRPDGLITVVVGAQGRLRDLRLDPRVYRKLDSGDLARAILELTSEATAEVTERMRQIMTPFVPGGAPGVGQDFAAHLPRTDGADDTEPGDG